MADRWTDLRDRLVAKRRAMGLSQTDLDAKLGLAHGHTAKYETDRRLPRADFLVLWAAGLDLDLTLKLRERAP